jgi:predicted acylesterase/phospholipase RssA
VPDWAENRIDKVVLNALANSSKGHHLLSFMEYGGWFAADAFVDWLEGKLNEGSYQGQRRNFGKMTFAELFQRTGFDLSLTGSDTTNNYLLVFNHRTTPDLPVVWGARMSMSLPLLWQEVVWREEWGQYRGHSATGHVVVDGGFLSNFPIELLVSGEPEVAAVMGPRTGNPVMGFLIDERIEVPGAPPGGQQAALPAMIGELRTARRLKGLLDTVTSARDKSVIATNERRVVRLPAKGYGTTEFNMTEARRKALVEAGRAVTQAFLDRPGDGLEGLEAAEDTAESDRIAVKMLDMSDF